jgi:N-acetylmuramoyl-L-alanine amidase
MCRAAALAALLLFTIPTAQAAPRKAAASGRKQPNSVTKRAKPAALPAAAAAMKSLMRDREQRRYRHNWERAIAGLLAAAKGRDAAAATLEAARARYALYRWSANESDRDKALILANRAAGRGSKDARALATAIRREAGDDAVEVARPVKPVDRARRSPTPTPTPAPAAQPEPAEAEDSEPDPTLAAAIADLQEPAGLPALKLGEDQGQGHAEITEVRSWASGDYSRVAVYLSHWVGWQRLELPPDAEQPRRLAFDFRPATLAGKALTRPVAGDKIDRVRAAQNAGDTVRVVLDLAGSDAAEVYALHDPPRLVVDVGARTPPPPPTIAGSASTPATQGGEGGSRPVRRIVVDAGHGGHDPGAIGRRGLQEKAVTLDIARRVAAELRKLGFDAILTRSTDRFLQLEERTALANTARADLFVSIHANANPRRNRSGIETYFLNVTDDRYAARLAARENGAELDGGESDVVLKRIRTDLDAVASAGSSKQLAELVQRELCSAVRTRFGDVRDLGVKNALFYVLLGARMPAVLVETGFISNAAEERRLAAPEYRAEVARAVAGAVRTFAQQSDGRVAAVH